MSLLTEKATAKPTSSRTSELRDQIIPMVSEIIDGEGVVPHGKITYLADIGLETFDITFGEDVAEDERKRTATNLKQNANVGWSNYGERMGFPGFAKNENRLTVVTVKDAGKVVGVKFGLEARPVNDTTKSDTVVDAG